MSAGNGRRPGGRLASSRPPVAPPAGAPAGELVELHPAPTAAAPGMPDFPTLEPRLEGEQGAGGITLAQLAQGRPDPDNDLVTVTIDVPRYVRDAVRAEHLRTRRPIRLLWLDAILSGRALPEGTLRGMRSVYE